MEVILKEPGTDEVLASPSSARRNAYHLLHWPAFEHSMSTIICLNFILVIIETDKVAEDANNVPAWIEVATWTVLMIFLLEVILRLYVYRRWFWHEKWNVFDFLVVFTDVVISVAGLIFGTFVSVSALRVLRLARLAQVSRAFRMFPELRMLLAGLIGSLRAIFWGTVLLTVILLLWSVLAVQFIHPLNKELQDKGHYQGCDRCPRAYESVLQACLTFFQQVVAGDSWGQATIPVIQEYPAAAIYFVSVFLSVGMAVLNLILGVVVNVAEQTKDSLKASIEAARAQARMEEHDHLRGMCQAMDRDGSGELTKPELLAGYGSNEEFRTVLNGMDIYEQELEIVWTIMDTDRSGKVSHPEFVSEVYKMKNSDSQFMLAYIKYYMTLLKHILIDGGTSAGGPNLGAEPKADSNAREIINPCVVENAATACAPEKIREYCPALATNDREAIAPTVREEDRLLPDADTAKAKANGIASRADIAEISASQSDEAWHRHKEILTAIRDVSKNIEAQITKPFTLPDEALRPKVGGGFVAVQPIDYQRNYQSEMANSGPLRACCTPEVRGTRIANDPPIMGASPQGACVQRPIIVGADLKAAGARQAPAT